MSCSLGASGLMCRSLNKRMISRILYAITQGLRLLGERGSRKGERERETLRREGNASASEFPLSLGCLSRIRAPRPTKINLWKKDKEYYAEYLHTKSLKQRLTTKTAPPHSDVQVHSEQRKVNREQYFCPPPYYINPSAKRTPQFLISNSSFLIFRKRLCAAISGAYSCDSLTIIISCRIVKNIS